MQGKTTSVSVVGVNQTTSTVNKIVDLEIKSIHNNFSTILNCSILPTITQSLPVVSVQKSKLSIPKNLKLADSDFNIKRPVDLLIGAELFWQLLCVGQIKLNNSGLCLRKTHLGWIASGRISNSPRSNSVINCNATIGNTLDILLTKFWQLEECTNTSPVTVEERKCETHFANTYKRDETGRFVVKLPFRDNMQQRLGDSKSTALKRLYNLERKLYKEHILKAQYSQFLEEYEALGHMRLVENPSDTGSSICLPHHAVIKSDSSTTKLRVVFDGSARTSSGISLNKALMAGPTVQQDLFSIICRFRIHTIVITANIEKMYQQINIHEDHVCFQRILGRQDCNQRIKTYELKTVTYGTTSAPYLATRALKQLTQIEAVLNSRPIHPMSNDPNDLTYLTPGDFLIGMPLTAPIEPNLEHLNINRLSRYQLIERIKQHFWSRWSKEYLQTLQIRSKWKSGNRDQLLLNDLVMIKEDGLPPLQWSIGRVVAIHPGNDNVVRCATIKTTKGTFTRASSKLCVLPVERVWRDNP